MILKDQVLHVAEWYDNATGVKNSVSASLNRLVLARRYRIPRTDFLASTVDPGSMSYQKETTARVAVCMSKFEAPKTDNMFIVVQVTILAVESYRPYRVDS